MTNYYDYEYTADSGTIYKISVDGRLADAVDLVLADPALPILPADIQTRFIWGRVIGGGTPFLVFIPIGTGLLGAARVGTTIDVAGTPGGSYEIFQYQPETHIGDLNRASVQGPIGPGGPAGPAGVAGPAGPAGNDGNPGADGAPGLPGLPGLPGADGNDGAPGTPGADGNDGAPGAPGAPGADGNDGAPGVDGNDGAPGAPGADGNDGAPGAAGTGELWQATDAQHRLRLQYRVSHGGGVFWAGYGTYSGIGGSGTAENVDDDEGMWIRFSTAASIGDFAGIALNNATAKYIHKPRFWVRAKIIDLASCRLWVGCNGYGLWNPASDYGNQGAAFMFNPATHANGNWRFFTGDNEGGSTVIDTGVPVTTGNILFCVDCTDSGAFKGYINGALVATSSSTLPILSGYLQAAAGVVALAAAVKQISLGALYGDWI